MATGGGGGGGFNFQLARAYVQIDVDMSRYTAGMATAQARFNAFTQRLTQIGARFATFSQASGHVDRLARSVSTLRAQLAASVTQAQRLATTLRGATLGPRTNTAAGILRGAGSGLASLTRGLGSGFASAAKGLGTGIGAALKGSAPLIRGLGSAFASVARGFGSLLSSVFRSVGSLAKSLGGALTAPLRALGGGGGLGRLLGLGGLAGGLTGGGIAAFAIRAAGQMEAQLASYRRVSGASAGEATDFGSRLQGMAKRMPVGLSDLFGMASTGARMGIPQEQLASFVRDMGRFSVALEGSGIDVQDATERIARLSAVFGTGSGSIARFGSALVKLDQMSTASASDILDISTRIAPMARTLGLTANRTMALAALAREGGVSPEVAGTSLSQLLSKMASRGSMPGFARLAGQSTKGFEANLRADPFGALMGVARGVRGMDPIKAIQALEGLHLSGQRVSQTLLALGAVSEKSASFTGAAAKEWLRLGATEDAVSLKSGTLFASMTKVGNILTITASKIGSVLLPIAKAALESIGEIAGQVGDYFDRNQATFTAWGERVARIVRMAGLFFVEFGTFAALGLSYAQEAWDKFTESIRRVSVRIGEWISFGFRAGVRIIKNLTFGLVDFVGSAFKQLGPILAAQLSNAIQDMLDTAPAAIKGLMIALNPALAFMPKTRVPVPEFVPDVGRLSHPLAGIGGIPSAIVPPKGFGGLLADLPNRAAERLPLLARLAAARAEREAQAKADAAREAMEGLNERAKGDLGPGGLLKRLLGRGAAPPVPGRVAARIARAHEARAARMERGRARHFASPAGRRAHARSVTLLKNPALALAEMTHHLTKLGSFLTPEMAAKAKGKADERAGRQEQADLITKGLGALLGVSGAAPLARQIALELKGLGALL